MGDILRALLHSYMAMPGFRTVGLGLDFTSLGGAWKSSGEVSSGLMASCKRRIAAQLHKKGRPCLLKAPDIAAKVVLTQKDCDRFLRVCSLAYLMILHFSILKHSEMHYITMSASPSHIFDPAGTVRSRATCDFGASNLKGTRGKHLNTLSNRIKSMWAGLFSDTTTLTNWG